MVSAIPENPPRLKVSHPGEYRRQWYRRCGFGLLLLPSNGYFPLFRPNGRYISPERVKEHCYATSLTLAYKKSSIDTICPMLFYKLRFTRSTHQISNRCSYISFYIPDVIPPGKQLVKQDLKFRPLDFPEQQVRIGRTVEHAGQLR